MKKLIPLLLVMTVIVFSPGCENDGDGRDGSSSYPNTVTIPYDDNYPVYVTVAITSLSSGTDQVIWGDQVYATLQNFQTAYVSKSLYRNEKIKITIVHLDRFGNYEWTSDEFEFTNRLPDYHMNIYDDHVSAY